MKILLLLIMAAWTLGAHAAVTLEQCLTAAEENYPLIRKYDLVEATEAFDLTEINRGWLPRLGLYAQGTVQNVVPSFPQFIGAQLRGLGKVQYKAGLDVTQTVWDGGASKSQRAIARQHSEVNRAALDVEMYAIRQRVESLYFGILLMESQIGQTQSAIEVYEANLTRLRSLVANGAAMQSDADMVEAQCLSLGQHLTQAQSALTGYRDMLALFTGLDLGNEALQLPSDAIPAESTPARPELKLLESQVLLNDAQRAMVRTSQMPKVGLFAQSYYGYPGIDYFKAMIGRDLTFNILAGVKVSWNIDSFYTRRTSLRKLDVANGQLAAERETFLFNTAMQSASQRLEIEGLHAVMADDARIVELRRNVRLAAESQLRNGIIDATALTTKINDETQAQLAASLHTIQYLQAVYNLKNTLNR